MTIGSKKLVDDLLNHGCIPRKSRILRFPTTVPTHLLNHFIRGYFDGDGSLSRDEVNWQLNICGTLEFLTEAQLILIDTCNLRATKLCKTRTIYQLHYRGNRQVERILDWLYCDATLYLERKYSLFQQFKEERKR